MADAICRWRNGTPKTVVELVNSMPHEVMLNVDFRRYMANKWNGDFFHTPYQLACQLALYFESDDGYYYPRFDHDITQDEADRYLFYWFPKYYIPNPFVRSDGFQQIECPTLFLKSLYDYVKIHPNCKYKDAYESVFHDECKNNDDIIKNYITKYSKVLEYTNNDCLKTTDYDSNLIFVDMDRSDKKAFFDSFKGFNFIDQKKIIKKYDKYLAALKTKPFLLLAGISGTGKSRLVQELAYMTCKRDGVLDKDAASPGNYCLIEVKPNWHDSTELLGYYSFLSKKYELTPFIRFVYKAIQNKDVPFFVCLDEMNLAPVEQYFAEYLSVLETRKIEDDGSYSSEPLLKSEIFNNCEPKPEDKDYEIIKELKENGLRLPQNLFVIGTVNMDDTTHQFSRKVIDRAFTIEMDGSDLKKMFEKTDTLNYQEKPLEYDFIKPEFVSAAKVLETYTSYTETIKEKVPEFLDAVNERFKNTPFRVSYRVQNEMILYIASLIRQSEDPSNIDIDSIISEASLSILMEKILPRVEGDDKLLGESLENLKSYILSSHSEVNQGDESSKTDSFLGITLAKLEEMQERLKSTYFTSFFS